jgi:hypothetical protein
LKRAGEKYKQGLILTNDEMFHLLNALKPEKGDSKVVKKKDPMIFQMRERQQRILSFLWMDNTSSNATSNSSGNNGDDGNTNGVISEAVGYHPHPFDNSITGGVQNSTMPGTGLTTVSREVYKIVLCLVLVQRIVPKFSRSEIY